MRPSALRSALAVLGLAATLGAAQARAFVWPNVPEQVARGLASGDVSERRLAAQRLIELPAEVALPLDQQAMGDPDVEVRLYAAQAAIAVRLPKAGDKVIPWLSEGDARLRLAACDVIRAVPTDRSVVALGRVLGDPDPHVRQAAAAAMGASGLPDAVSPLLGHLDDTSPEVRQEVARALGRIGDSRAVVPMIGKVQDSVPEVRRVVARALGELGDTRAASALMLALQDASADVRLEAVGALGRLRAEDATTAIAPLVDDGAAGYGRPSGSSLAGAGEVRAAALRALGRIGSAGAIKVLVGALAKDDRTALRSPVRDALVAAGKPAAGVLVATLAGSPSANTAAGAALALGALREKAGGPAIVKAMQRGVVPLREGLRALALLGSADTLPTVLEVLDDADPGVRKEAIRAAIALLDPGHPDGRPVDPARGALADRGTPIDEKIELCRLLGRTGAPRAQAVLLPLASAKQESLRVAALESLGTLGVGSPAVDKALLDGLDDESARIRLKSALSLARVASPAAAALLLERLVVSAEQDRGALGIALSGALARAADPALAEKVRAAIPAAPESARDALIEALGRMHGPEAGAALAAIAGGSIDDRRKVAEALGSHAEAAPALLKLAADPDPGVRANAVWSLGKIASKEQLAAIGALAKDPDVAVAGNAVAALGLVAGRAGDPAAASAALCPALADGRPYVRVNALAGLSVAGARCEGNPARELVVRDSSQAVRLAAAEHLLRVQKPEDADRRALLRCASEDHDSAVAARCARPLERSVGAEDVAIYVVPDGRDVPLPRAPFALVRADGLLRLGLADRRGELFESAAPKGAVRLAVPAALVR